MHAPRRTLAAAASLALAVPLAFAAPAVAATKVTTITAGLTRVNLLNINDFHGAFDTNLDGTSGRQLACLVETAKSTLGEEQTLFLAAGDLIGGSAFASMLARDEPTIAYLNALELKASALGNHEFDQGAGDLDGRVSGLANWNYLGANVYQRGTTTPAYPEYSQFTVNGLRVAVIGAVTAEVPSLVSPTGIAGLDFGDPVDAVNRVADRLTDGVEANGEADVLVAEYHNGAVGATALADELAASADFARIVNQTSAKVAAIFNGHTHQRYAYDAPIPGGTGTRPVLQTGSTAGALGQVQLGFDADRKLVEYAARNVTWPSTTPIPDSCKADPQYHAADAIITSAVDDAKAKGNVVVSTITTDITRAWADGKSDDRSNESTLSNLQAEVWKQTLDKAQFGYADIGVQNPGGVRRDLRYAKSGVETVDGQVTYAEAAMINPFANVLQTIDLTGAQFKQVLEQQWQPSGSTRPYLQLGLSRNVTYTYDPTRTAGDRIVSVTVDGEALDPVRTYRIATNSFLTAGGDNFTAFRQGTNSKDSGLIDTDAFVNWLKANAPVTPTYAKQAVAVIGQPTWIPIDTPTTLTVQGLALTSLGTPADTMFTVYADGKRVSTFSTAAIDVTKAFATPIPTRLGESNVTVRLLGRDFKSGMKNRFHTITLVADKTGTTITVPIRVK